MRVPPLRYWCGKSVLITGINGFIGGNLAEALTAAGANVFGLIRNRNSRSYLFHEGLDRRVTLVEGDLGDKELLTRVIGEEQIHTIFHLASQVEVGVAAAHPQLTFETNVRGTYQLLEAVRLASGGVRAVVVASSDKAYGSYPRRKMPYREDYPLIPRYPYDVSKACADMIAQSYASELYRLPILVTRFSNIYGPGQLNFSAVLPDAIRACLGYGKFVPRGDGTQIRDFLFVKDVVALYLAMAESLAHRPEKLRGKVFNAGTRQPLSIREVLAVVHRLTGRESDLPALYRGMKKRKTTGEIDCQFMDYATVRKEFGWTPKTRFAVGAEETIAWFRAYFERTPTA